MGIALTLQSYFGDHHVAYDITRHDRTGTSSRTAETSHVPGERLAKGVVLKSAAGYILAVLPASRRIAMEAVEQVTGSPVELASEAEASMLFPDCDQGAIPVFGEAYGIPAMVEASLDDSRDIYCEGGDHLCLVRMDGRDFRTLMARAERAHFAA
ncbi:MAG: YbaK/EbsC family protein [Rhizobiales bacterium]|nr:YbaK/EbsC family protein [Hyphomicrobiales bacterium]